MNQNKMRDALLEFTTAMDNCCDYPDTSGDIDSLRHAKRHAEQALAAPEPAQSVEPIELRELIDAALNMIDVKGRHHSEIAMKRLIEAAKKYREKS